MGNLLHSLPNPLHSLPNPFNKNFFGFITLNDIQCNYFNCTKLILNINSNYCLYHMSLRKNNGVLHRPLINVIDNLPNEFADIKYCLLKHNDSIESLKLQIDSLREQLYFRSHLNTDSEFLEKSPDWDLVSSNSSSNSSVISEN